MKFNKVELKSSRKLLLMKEIFSFVIFSSRWTQIPVYLGLIVAQVMYVVEFCCELLSLLDHFSDLDHIHVMIVVLNLIDIALISNLLIMVIIGGYETFIEKLSMRGDPHLPKWLLHVNTNTLKVKVLTSLVCISALHLLKAFIDIHNLPDREILWECIIHGVFAISAFMLTHTTNISEHGNHVSQNIYRGNKQFNKKNKYKKKVVPISLGDQKNVA